MEYIPSLQSNIDTLKPSLFELLSEQQLASLLPPTLRYLLAITTHRYPRYLLRILNKFDEVYALVALVVEKYYLEHFGGSFTENFYGLKRERVLDVKGGEVRRTQLAVPSEVREKLRLRGKDVWRNLAVLVALPYVKRRLDEAYDVHIAPQASLLRASGGPQYRDGDAWPQGGGLREKLMWCYKWFLRNVYPSVNMAYYTMGLLFSLGYLFDGTKYNNPWLWLVRTRMRRMGGADYQAIDAASEAASKALRGDGRPGQGLSGILSPRTLYPRLLSSLRILLPTSIFALKFLEWWHQSDFARQLSRKAAEGLELPPPVVSGMGLARIEAKKRDVKANSGVKREPPISSTNYLPILSVPPPSSSDLCPICLHPMTNQAACQTGYVFDYKCIFQWIEGTHDRQEAFMKGEKMSEWEEDEEEDAAEEDKPSQPRSRQGQWDSGKGRCAVTGRRVLGGTGGLRRVLV